MNALDGVTEALPKREMENEREKPRKKKAKSTPKAKLRNQEASQVSVRKKKGKKKMSEEVELKSSEIPNIVDAAKLADTLEGAVGKRKGKRSKSLHNKPSSAQTRPQTARPDLIANTISPSGGEGKPKKSQRDKSQINVIKRPASAISQSSSGYWSKRASTSRVNETNQGVKRELSGRAKAAIHYGQVLTDAVVGLVDEKLKANEDDQIKLPPVAELKSQLNARETKLLLSSRQSSSGRGNKTVLKSVLKNKDSHSSKAATTMVASSKASNLRSRSGSRAQSTTRRPGQEGSKSFHGPGLGGDFITVKEKYERPNIEDALKRAVEAVAEVTAEPSRVDANKRPSTVPIPQGAFSTQAAKIMEASRYNVAVNRGKTQRPRTSVPSQGALVRSNQPKKQNSRTFNSALKAPTTITTAKQTAALPTMPASKK